MVNETEIRSARWPVDAVSVPDHRFGRHVALSVGALVAIALILMLGFVWWIAHDEDRHALAVSRRVAQGAIASHRELLADQVLDYAEWDDAFDHLHEQIDPDWADANIGSWIHSVAGIDMSFVVAPDDRLAYAMSAGRRVALNGERVATGLRLLVESARRARIPEPSTALVSIAGRPALAAVRIIRRQGGPWPERPSLLVFVDLLDKPFLAHVERHFGLTDLGWRAGEDGSHPGSLVVAAADGTLLGVLTWDLELPGSAMLQGLLPVLLGVVLVVGALAVLALHHTQRTTRLLRAAEVQGMHDPLTGLPNRLLLIDRLELTLAVVRRESCRAAVIYLDLDGFKAVNDRFGHEWGDMLLAEVASRLRYAVRATDTVARIGGDEFVIVQTGGAQPETAALLCQRLLQVLATPFSLGDHHQARLGVSIGIAVVPDDAEDPANLLRLADRAMYRAKAEGRGTFRFHRAEGAEKAHGASWSRKDEREAGR